MDLKDEQEIAPPAPQDKPTLWDRLQTGGDTSWMETAWEESESCAGNPLRLLWRNIWGGIRIALSLRVSLNQFCASPAALASLAITDFLLNWVTSFLLVGRGGFFSYSAIPYFFFHIPLLLLFGLWAGRILSRRSLLTIIPVALVSLSIPLELCHAVIERIGQLEQFKWLELYLEAPHYYRFYWWWSVTSILFLWRLEPGPRSRRLWAIALFSALVLPPLWYYSRPDLWVNASENGESGELHLTEQVLAAQAKLLDGELDGLEPGRKGVSDLYFVGFAGDATQDVFLKEVKGAERLFHDRFGTAGRAVILVNNPQTASTLPFATAGNLKRALARVGEAMNRDEDVLFLYLTSHGSKEHELAVNNRPLELDGLTPEKVRAMLKASGIQWKVVVVSACYSGGFIDALKESHTLVITASDATHESFGCGFGEEYTWFGQAYLKEALGQTYSFTKAFEKARETIGQWEEKEYETPSNPQIWVGKDIAPKLARLEKELRSRRE